MTERATNCNCCRGCQKAFTEEELTYYRGIDSLTNTTLCFSCQDEYERETREKEDSV